MFCNLCGQRLNLDLVGRVLERCKKLVFFDVSFCAGIDFATVLAWKQQYPHVSIKKSFQS